MKRVHHFFIGGDSFRKEFRKQMRFLIIITLGFTIAFSWRQTVFDAVQTLVQKILHTSGLPSSVLTSVFITIIGIILIYFASHILKDDRER